MSNQPSSLKPWQPGQPIEAARLQALQERAVLSVHVGPGLTVARVGNDVTIALGDRLAGGGVSVPHILRLCRVATAAGGKAKYNVRFSEIAPAAAIDPGVAATAGELGADLAASPNALGINLLELLMSGASTTHILSNDSGPFPAWLLPTLATDDRPVVLFFGIGGC